MGKGVWEARKIANPDFVDDDMLYKYNDFSFIGFDLWQGKGGTIFDNIIITDDKSEADQFAKKWEAVNAVEKVKKKEEDDKKAEEDKASADAAGADDDGGEDYDDADEDGEMQEEEEM